MCLFVFSSLAVLLIAGQGCAGSSQPSTFGQYEQKSARESNRVVHIHGLAINPENNLLYAATHGGLFAIQSDGTAVRVGSGYQDTMGFTIVGPDQFLASIILIRGITSRRSGRDYSGL